MMFGDSNTEAWHFPSPLSENSQQWGSSFRFDRDPQKSISARMHEMSTSPQMMAKIDGLSQKIDAFMASEPYPHHPFTFCVTCSSPTHPTQSCPYNASYPEPIEDLHTFQNFQRLSYNYPYSEP